VRYPDPTSVPHAQVVGVYGAFHLGQLQVGLSRAVRLAQCRAARITLRGPLPVQVDGEPWLQPPAVLTVSHTGQARRPLTRCARHADTICFCLLCDARCVHCTAPRPWPRRARACTLPQRP